MGQKSELIQGTLDMLVLRVLARESVHGWGITQRLEQLSASALKLDEGSLYPALYRMENKGWIDAEWRMTDKGRRAKFYALTRAGRRQLEIEKEDWSRMTAIIARVMES
ncbi:MAG TPA: PadR family transcriptional regulator [Opitutaceae bacterium]|jgi:transcriptional regulator